VADPSPDATTPVALVGVHGGAPFGQAGRDALALADVVIGARRHLDELPSSLRAIRVPLIGPLTDSLTDADRRAAQGQRVVLVTSGDPGFFGLVRLARERLGADRLVVHPAPSSVSLAFARLGEEWDDARIVSAHGRPLPDAVAAAVAPGPGRDKVAVLTSPDQPPEVVAAALLAAGAGDRRSAVCSHLGSTAETVVETNLSDVAAGRWDPVSILILRGPAPAHPRIGGAGVTRSPSGEIGAPSGSARRATRTTVGWEAPGFAPTGSELRWGAPEEGFAHRAGMITKAEVRAVALGKLALPPHGVVWDVGAGSGAVAAEIAALVPTLEVFAVEQHADDVANIEANVIGLGVTVVHGVAPAALVALPDPDRVFIGGGGPEVLDAALARLRPGGTVVATYAALERAAAAGRRLGHLVQLSISRGQPIGPEGALRLRAENPVFVCWGPA
jgi:precorrin-6Y C5,15-methyltransferase (decarboxylating)